MNARQRQVRAALRDGHPLRYRPVLGLGILAAAFVTDVGRRLALAQL